MKRFIVLLSTMLLLCGCTSTPSDGENASADTVVTIIPEETTETIITETNEASTEEFVLNYELDIIRDGKVAAELAMVVFKHAEKPEGAENYTVIDVGWADTVIDVASADNRVVVVLFGDEGVTVDQILNKEVNSCHISIDPRTGRIIGINFYSIAQKTGDGFA